MACDCRSGLLHQLDLLGGQREQWSAASDRLARYCAMAKVKGSLGYPRRSPNALPFSKVPLVPRRRITRELRGVDLAINTHTSESETASQ